jgi:hypothetical protein
MSRFLRTVVTALLLLPMLGIGGCIGYLFYQGRRFGYLEENARKVITPQELQAWALRLIADSHSYTNSAQFNTIRTNYPSQLGKLVPGLGPDVNINEANSINSPLDWTNIPPSVSLIWGSGPLGHRGFIVGPTNLESGGNQWAPGVYFFKR